MESLETVRLLSAGVLNPNIRDLDETDLEIMELLLSNARRPYSDIVEVVFARVPDNDVASWLADTVDEDADAREFSRHLPEPVDVVLLANTFHGIDDTGAVLRQAFETLRPGGQFVVVNGTDEPRETTTIGGEPRGPPTELRMAPDQTVQDVTDATEFTLLEEIDLPPYHYALRFDR